MSAQSSHKNQGRSLYTPEQRARRDATIWTFVQGVLAPVQFIIFLISVALVIRYLMTGEGYAAATASILLKTFALYTIMVTGAIWEKVVFGRYLFAQSFFWEDAVSFVVIAIHTFYLWALWSGALSPKAQMLVALAAYAIYVINAAQFVWKLRMARLEATPNQGVTA
ncbi:2-vinyl bacteriochlorophyllide hydratase [Nereida sp. NH-UV-3]|uniref:2-vinyl bacteriochlorophyllide hydratase n=1 Tax=Nereida TaxID=282198 RepID=UPI0036F219E5